MEAIRTALAEITNVAQAEELLAAAKQRRAQDPTNEDEQVMVILLACRVVELGG